MSKSAHLNSKLDSKHSDTLPAAQKLHVGRELFDTTWRMTIPVVLFAGLGIIADRSAGSKPWLTLLGVVVGFGFAALLIKQQLGKWPDMPVTPGAKTKRTKQYDDEEKDYYND